MLQHLMHWVEIPAVDVQRAKKFYEQIFQFEMQRMPMGDAEYAFFPVEDRFNCGALVQSPNHKPSADGITVYLNGGTDMDSILSRVQNAGGQVIMKKSYTGEMAGYIGMFLDSEGNRIGLQHM